MNFSRIEHYASRWIDGEGRMIVIEICGVQSALVRLFGKLGRYTRADTEGVTSHDQ